MKAISIPEIVSQLRQKRSGRTFIAEFINQCECIDAIPLDKIKQAREEIENIGMGSYLEVTKEIECNNREVRMSKKFAIAILDKLIESEEK